MIRFTGLLAAEPSVRGVTGGRQPITVSDGIARQPIHLRVVVTQLKTSTSDPLIQGVTIEREERGVARDTIPSPSTPDSRATAYLVSGSYTPSRPGAYTATVTALMPTGEAVQASLTFRAIAPGGSNNDPLPNDPPKVITELTSPKEGAKGVAVSGFIQVVFTEPVRNVPGNVSLVPVGGGEAVPLILSGVGPGGPMAEITSSGATVTSLTIQPRTTLRYGALYRLSLTSEIVDLDTAQAEDPKELVPYELTFTTFAPEDIGESGDAYGSPGLALLGDRAFGIESHFTSGILRSFDITDPVAPKDIPSAATVFVNRPVDVAAEGHTVVVATGPAAANQPSRVLLYDVNDRKATTLEGSTHVTQGVMDGYINRMVLRDDRV